MGKYILTRPPEPGTEQYKAWMDKLSRFRLHHRIHVDTATNTNTTTALETLKSMSFPASLIRNSNSEIAFEVIGLALADGATRTLHAYLNSTLGPTTSFAYAGGTQSFNIKGKVVGTAVATNTFRTTLTTIKPSETVPVSINSFSSAISPTVGDDDLLTLSIRCTAPTVGIFSVTYFAVDYIPQPVLT